MTNQALLVSLVSLLVALTSHSAVDPAQQRRFEFVRMAAHWTNYGEPEYLQFLSDAKIEVAQVGFYGGHFWSLGNTDLGKGYPMNLPCVGLGECGTFFEKLNRDIHQRGAKVVGHFNVEFLVGDPESPEGPRGFFKFCRELWDEKELGPKPVADPLELLQTDADGKPITAAHYSIGGVEGEIRN